MWTMADEDAANVVQVSANGSFGTQGQMQERLEGQSKATSERATAVCSATASNGQSDEDEREEACFEDDTDSFMLRKRVFHLSGLPPGRCRTSTLHVSTVTLLRL